MITNPVKIFRTGGDSKDQVFFTYAGGSKLFHFCPYDNGLSTTLEENLVFFADSEEQAMNTLIEMFNFCKEALEHRLSIGYFYLELQYKEKLKRVNFYLDAISQNKVKLTEAPMNQFYQVGWASNDTIL